MRRMLALHAALVMFLGLPLGAQIAPTSSDTGNVGSLAFGRLDPFARMVKLMELEDTAAVQSSMFGMKSVGTGGSTVLELGKVKPYEHTNHAFGYIAPPASGATKANIVYAGAAAADQSLKNGRIRITLDRLRVADYPGKGVHRVLFNFSAQNQVGGAPETIHFNQTYRATEGSAAGLVGYPIFLGLNVGTTGVMFRCSTVNVENEGDERFLQQLESGAASAGLQLLTSAQPAIKPLSDLALGITKAVASRNKNVAVQDFAIGLDFGGAPTGARLAVGSYVAVQVPDDQWDWSEWEYIPASGRIQKKSGGEPIPYNYIVFSITKG